MNKFLISKIAAIFFGITTVILFVLSREGRLFDIAGSVQAGMAVYFINAFFLIISFTAFIWYRAQKDLPQKQKSKILEAYADIEANSELRSPSFSIKNDELLVIKSTDETIYVTTNEYSRALQPGDDVELSSPESMGYHITAEVVSTSESKLRVRRKNIK